MKSSVAALAIFALCAFAALAAPSSNPLASSRQKALDLVTKLSTAQKLSLLHGQKDRVYVGETIGYPKLGIPPLHLQDGPQGVGDGLKDVTAWPCALAAVSSFDTELMSQYGAAMATEQKGKGTNVLLGPMMNIARIPTGGRNFESFGEDPHLASEMAKASIKGIQSVPGMMACAKHYVDNNQELNRTLTSANVDERTQHEIYLPHFQASVDAGVASFMCSYNKIHDVYACENEYTLKTVLKGEMGYLGFVMSDWGATHSTVDAANNGLDMEMPGDRYFGKTLTEAVANGQVSMAVIDDKVVRILTSMFYTKQIGNPPTGNISAHVNSTADAKLARSFSAQSTVLVKNSPPKGSTTPLLPLSPSVKTIAIVGDDGLKNPTCVGWGSGRVVTPYCIAPYDGLASALGDSVKLLYAADGDMDGLKKIAAEADLVILFFSAHSSEGSDRPTLSLGSVADQMVTTAASINPNTVVVLHSPGACLMPWYDSVASIVVAWYPGQENGNAIADVLTGAVNPAARVPVTFPMTDSQVPASSVTQYPGIDNEADYTEDLLVGYRWYATKKAVPRIPFGHGLSYTTFSYSNFVSSCTHCAAGSKFSVSVVITNTGKSVGAEVPQLYVTFPSAANEPAIQLIGFEKLSILPGASSNITFDITPRKLSVWEVSSHAFRVFPGDFVFSIGASSADIRATVNVNVF